MDYICGKRLQPMLPELLPVLECFNEFSCDRETRAKLLRISAASIDRLLTPERRKYELRGPQWHQTRDAVEKAKSRFAPLPSMSLRKVTKARGSFPNDEAVFKLLYLALRNIAKKWTMSVHDWKAALTVLPSSTKTGCRLNSCEMRKMKVPGKNPGYGNRGKTNRVFPPFPQPLLLTINLNKKRPTLTTDDRLHKQLTLPQRLPFSPPGMLSVSRILPSLWSFP